MHKNIKDPKIGDIVFFKSDYPTITKGKPYKILDVEREQGNIWVDCDDGIARRGSIDIFYSKKVAINKNCKII